MGMKAIEYYNTYGASIMDEISEQKTHQAVQSFLNAFEDESIHAMKSRKPNNERAVVAVLKQQNRKWNSICWLFEREYGHTPFKRNAYWNIMSKELKCSA